MLIHLPNSVEWLVSFLATLRAGHVPATTLITTPGAHLAHVVDLIDPAAVITCERQLDVTDHARIEEVIGEVVETTGRIDVLVNNAGWSRIEPVAEMSIETWQRCLDVDLTGTFVCTRHVLPPMIAAGGGSIVNISSIAAWEMSTDHGAAYSAAKAGVLALTRVTAAGWVVPTTSPNSWRSSLRSVRGTSPVRCSVCRAARAVVRPRPLRAAPARWRLAPTAVVRSASPPPSAGSWA